MEEEFPVSDEPTTAPEGSGAVSAPKHLRASFWGNLSSAFKHIRAASNAESSRLRGSDYVSVISFPLAAVLLASSAFMPHGILLRPWFVLFLLIALLYFIASRIGVVKSFTPRQAHLVWMIVVATFITGSVFALFLFEILRIM